MPAQLLSFPFRIGSSGAAATVEHGSDDHINELLAVAATTSPGERIQAPTFGVPDPAFDGFAVAALQRHCADFGPDVTIVAAGSAQRDDSREALTISWQRNGGEV